MTKFKQPNTKSYYMSVKAQQREVHLGFILLIFGCISPNSISATHLCREGGNGWKIQSWRPLKGFWRLRRPTFSLCWLLKSTSAQKTAISRWRDTSSSAATMVRFLLALEIYFTVVIRSAAYRVILAVFEARLCFVCPIMKLHEILEVSFLVLLVFS